MTEEKSTLNPNNSSGSATTRSRALWALILVSPAASVGAFIFFWIAPDTAVGHAGYVFGKAWLYGLPLVWFLFFERNKPKWTKPDRRGLLFGLGLGLAISAAIWGAFVFFAESRVDPLIVQNLVEKIGLGDPTRYILAGVYIALINAALEEYVFRWFIFGKCKELMHPVAAIGAAALIFTVHHVIVLRAYFEWPIALLASAGVFMGGVIWTLCYLKFRSIWPAYISHAIVDVAVFAVGWKIIFG